MGRVPNEESSNIPLVEDPTKERGSPPLRMAEAVPQSELILPKVSLKVRVRTMDIKGGKGKRGGKSRSRSRNDRKYAKREPHAEIDRCLNDLLYYMQ